MVEFEKYSRKNTWKKYMEKIHKEFAKIKAAIFLAYFYTLFQAPTICRSQSQETQLVWHTFTVKVKNNQLFMKIFKATHLSQTNFFFCSSFGWHCDNY